MHPTAAAGLGVRSESVVFELGKFLRLWSAANPNALEILFADDGTVYNGKAYWFWGDTTRVEHPLGNFSTTSATSRLPGTGGGLDPARRVDLTYFTKADGFNILPPWLPGPPSPPIATDACFEPASVASVPVAAKPPLPPPPPIDCASMP